MSAGFTKYPVLSESLYIGALKSENKAIGEFVVKFN